MIDIPFTKAHGAHNDFLLTWRSDAGVEDFPAFARAICNRYTGVGADGWILVDPEPELAIELYNSDGSKPELSGNGTRCAAAFLIREKKASAQVMVRTGAGLKHLGLLEKEGPIYWFEMEMGPPRVVAERFALQVAGNLHDVTILDVGNPQCAIPVEDFEFDWRTLARQVEAHPHFPKRTNVSLIRRVDGHTIDVRFYERGAGETMSSGTGSTGAVAAAIVRGMVTSPVRVLTPAGPLELRWNESIYLTGPAELTVDGVFHYGSI
jgi:diaminopimelate epimerase